MDFNKLSLEEIKAHKRDIEATLDSLTGEVDMYKQRLSEAQKVVHFKTADTPSSMFSPSRFRFDTPKAPTPSPVMMPINRGKLNLLYGPTKKKPTDDIEEFDPVNDIAISVTVKGCSIVDGPCPPTPNWSNPVFPSPLRVKFIGYKYYVLDKSGRAWEYKEGTGSDIRGKYVGVYDPILKEFYSDSTKKTTKVQDLIDQGAPTVPHGVQTKTCTKTINFDDSSSVSSVKAVCGFSLPKVEKSAMSLPTPIPIEELIEESSAFSPRRRDWRDPGMPVRPRVKITEKRSRSLSPIPYVTEYPDELNEPFRQEHLTQVGQWVLNSQVVFNPIYGSYIIIAPSGAVFKWNQSTKIFSTDDDLDMNFRGPKLGYWDPIRKTIIKTPYEEVV